MIYLIQPEWMAPEVMEGAPYNESIDVYSYGIVLTELLSRQRPFAGTNLLDTLFSDHVFSLHLVVCLISNIRSDQYKIESYDDVCDAVLDDGAKPTIPEW